MNIRRKGTLYKNYIFEVLKWGALKSDFELPKGKNKIAVDIGSAHGYVVDLLSKLGYFACGCELSKFFIMSYAKNNAENIIQGDAQFLPFEQKRIDVITAFELIEHLPQYSHFLSGCYDALKEGGALFLTTPQLTLKPLNLKFWRDYALGSLVLNSHNIDGHSHEFESSAELKSELLRKGFRKIVAETWWFAPVSPTLFNRYFVGRLPLFVIPHLRCIAIK